MKPSVIIIGAGAAGLMAALELAGSHDVTVLEMHAEPGGRMRTIDVKNFPEPIEDGAEFVHGKLPVTLDLLNKAGISYTAIEGSFYRVINGQWKQEEDFIEGWDELMHKMSKADEDMTLLSFLDTYYNEEQHRSFRKEVIRYANGFDLADEKRASARALYEEWKNEEETNFRITGGYRQLVRYMEQKGKENGCRFLYGHTVTHVNWSEGNVTVTTSGNQSFSAQKLIITQPVALLAVEESPAFIQLDPEPATYRAAAQDIGSGTVIKVQFLFSRPFWEEDHKNTGFIISDEVIPTWWTQLPDTTALLTGWFGGPPAAKWAYANTSTLIDMGIRSLAGIFNVEEHTIRSQVLESHVSRWTDYPAYSYSTPRSAAARQLLRTPLQHTLYFCGEALYEGKSPGTVEAALVAGKEVVERMLGHKRV